MGGSRLQSNKPHKSRFASKSSRHLHKTSNSDKKRAAKPDIHNASKGARAARLQRNKMVRDNKRAEILKEKRALSASNSPPRVIVLFGLSASANLKMLAENLRKILSSYSNDDMCVEDIKVDEKQETNINTFSSPTYKLKLTVMVAPHGDLMSCLEMAKVADLIAFVASANTSSEEELCHPFIDSFSNQCLSMFRALGLPSTVVLITDLPADLKKRQEARKICTASLSSEFPEGCKFFAAETKEELHKFLWLFKEHRQTVPHWRSLRSYLMAHEVTSVNGDSDSLHNTLRLSGYVRAQNLSINQLVHVSGAGDFQICQIDVLEDPFILKERKQHTDSMEFDTGSTDSPKVIRSLFPDASKQEPLVIENVPDPLAGEQTWPTEAEMAEADKISKEKRLKKNLPKGTSDYQAAWILDETDDEDKYSDEEEDNGMVLDEEQNGDAGEGNHCSSLVAWDDDQVSVSFTVKTMDEKTEADISMADEENLTKEEIEKEIQKLKDAHAEDEEFPDEVDTPLDIAARKRFAKYRGLKSFRSSSWDPKESLPPDYARIFAFDKFSRTQKHVLAKARRIDEGCQNEYVSIGSYVCVHIKHVPVSVSTRLCSISKVLPVVVCGLFQHESKMSVLHFSVQKHESYDHPIKSKEPMTFHVGFRQFNARPIFSSDDLNVDKHKMERFLHPGRFSIASVYAPISFPPLPVIMFKSTAGEASGLVFAGSGSLRSVNPDRTILKKIILTGYPQRVSKSKATVRFMFHNPEDVRWFKPVDLWTKCGRRGRIKEPVGTHGSMKCIFDGVVQQHDTVCMNLYKRVYPKWPERIYA
ncbi:uncharacterized protein LOC116262459 [Nymphaea colorata]|nr:uncharacterized protein LOC116262459 [Nymphaea colorata]